MKKWFKDITTIEELLENIISRYFKKLHIFFALYWQFSRLFRLKNGTKKALSAFYSQKCDFSHKLAIS